jgi:PqqD family protein of HPr-rel-A system
MRQEWKAVADFEWRAWDGEAVAYCDASGHTFKLAPIAAVILQHIAEAPCDLDSLTDHVRRTLPAEHGDALRAEVEVIVEEFSAMGIVERVAA